MKSNIGDIVYIEGHWNFPNDCMGTISEPPDFAVQLVANQEPGEDLQRIVNGYIVCR